jgi:hypothetical protein
MFSALIHINQAVKVRKTSGSTKFYISTNFQRLSVGSDKFCEEISWHTLNVIINVFWRLQIIHVCNLLDLHVQQFAYLFVA